MKKLIIAGMFIALLVLSGCESTPEETTDSMEVQPTTELSLADANEALKVDIAKAREMAIEAGAEDYFADELMVVDVASSEAHTVYEDGGDEQSFNDAATDILYQYRAIEQITLAEKAKMKIDEMGFESYDSTSYAEGMEAAAKTDELFVSGADGKTLYDEAKKALDAYNQVLLTAFSSLAEEKRAEFLAVKEQADEIKSNVADKDNYNNAVVFFTQGNADLNTNTAEGAEAALENFTVAASSMTAVFETVTEKRRLALEAMERARQRAETADAVAESADAQVPLADVEALETLSEEETQGGE